MAVGTVAIVVLVLLVVPLVALGLCRIPLLAAFASFYPGSLMLVSWVLYLHHMTETEFDGAVRFLLFFMVSALFLYYLIFMVIMMGVVKLARWTGQSRSTTGGIK